MLTAKKYMGQIFMLRPTISYTWWVMEAIQVFLQEKDYYIKNIRHKQWEILKV